MSPWNENLNKFPAYFLMALLPSQKSEWICLLYRGNLSQGMFVELQLSVVLCASHYGLPGAILGHEQWTKYLIEVCSIEQTAVYCLPLDGLRGLNKQV